MVKIVRITGSGFVKTGSITDGHPVEFRHWKDVVEEAEAELEAAADSESEEAAIEVWLENPQAIMSADTEADTQGVGISTIKTGMLRRADNFSRTRTAAVQQSWDGDFADAQAHVANILKDLGNGTDRNFTYRPATPGKIAK
jgi:hypothetical protein